MSQKAAELVASEISSAKSQFSLALPGGNSVAGLLKELSTRKLPWQAVNVFMADERLVPINDAQSNYLQANDLLFSKVQGIHAFPFEMEKGIVEYNRKFMAVTRGVLGLVVLGVGEDGHIASLFPNHSVLGEESGGYVEVHNATKPPAFRISLTPTAIRCAEAIVLLFASDTKKRAFEKFIDKSIVESECPAKIALKAKRVYVFTVFGGKNAE